MFRRLLVQRWCEAEFWWTHKGSNLGPLPCEGNALPLGRLSAPTGMLQDAFRLTTLRKVSSILDCQPSPVALKCSITSGLRRSDTSFFVGALFGPRPFRIEAARSGKTSANGAALAKSAFVSSGLSLTSRKSFRL